MQCNCGQWTRTSARACPHWFPDSQRRNPPHTGAKPDATNVQAQDPPSKKPRMGHPTKSKTKSKEGWRYKIAATRGRDILMGKAAFEGRRRPLRKAAATKSKARCRASRLTSSRSPHAGAKPGATTLGARGRAVRRERTAPSSGKTEEKPKTHPQKPRMGHPAKSKAKSKEGWQCEIAATRGKSYPPARKPPPSHPES